METERGLRFSDRTERHEGKEKELDIDTLGLPAGLLFLPESAARNHRKKGGIKLKMPWSKVI